MVCRSDKQSRRSIRATGGKILRDCYDRDMIVIRTIRHLFTPHHTNNHRARVLHIDAMVVYLLAFVLFRMALSIGHARFPDVLGFATDIRVDQLLAATNTKRAQTGLPPLVLDQRLSRAAARKAQDMFSGGYWAHNSPDGKTPWEFISQAGYRYRVAGENLAKNFSVSDAVVDAWMASPTHRDNLMRKDYNDIGFAVVNGVLAGEETTLVVQMFASGDSQLAYQMKPMIFTPSAASSSPVQVSAQESPATVAAQNSAVQLARVFVRPSIDISGISKYATSGFAGFILLIVAVDGWIVNRRKIIRVAPHSAGHAVFFAVMILLIRFATWGTVL